MAEWLAAELVKPHWFAGRGSTRSVTTSTQTVSVGDDSTDEVSRELRRQSFWIYLISIVAIIGCSCQVVWWLFVFIRQIVAPSSNGAFVVGQLTATFCGFICRLGLYCSILLLRYGNSVSV